MLSKDFLNGNGNRFALLIGQLVILVMCISYLSYYYIINILPDKNAATNFQTTSCFVTNKKISTHGFIFRRYRADFLITYIVQGVQYNRWVSGNGLDNAYSQNESGQEEILSQYEIGRYYNCWYNLQNPQTAILVPRHHWYSTFPLMLPVIIGVISFYYFLKAVLQLFGLKLTIKRKMKLEVKHD